LLVAIPTANDRLAAARIVVGGQADIARAGRIGGHAFGVTRTGGHAFFMLVCLDVMPLSAPGPTFPSLEAPDVGCD